MVPMLTGWLKLSQHRAHGTSLAIITFVATSGVAGYWHAGNIDWRLVLALAPGAVVGVYVGARAMVRVPALQLRLLFGTFLLFVAFRQLVWHVSAGTPQGGAAGLLIATAFGFAGGMLAGMLGVGGGAIFVPAIVIFGLAARRRRRGSAEGRAGRVAGCDRLHRPLRDDHEPAAGDGRHRNGDAGSCPLAVVAAFSASLARQRTRCGRAEGDLRVDGPRSRRARSSTPAVQRRSGQRPRLNGESMSMDATHEKRTDALALIAEAGRVAARDCALCRAARTPSPARATPTPTSCSSAKARASTRTSRARPFVGAAGKFLEELLRSHRPRAQDVFIANVVKCRPPQQPRPAAGRDRGLQQVPRRADRGDRAEGHRHARPPLACSATSPASPISRIHGQPRRKGDLIVVPMYHPAAALHQGSLREVIEADFKRLPDFLAKTLGGDGRHGAASSGARATLTERVPAHRSTSRRRRPDRRPTQGEPQQMRLL